MWATNSASYQNIGRTSTERCGYEREFRTFRLEYKNPEYVLPIISVLRLNLFLPRVNW